MQVTERAPTRDEFEIPIPEPLGSRIFILVSNVVFAAVFVALSLLGLALTWQGLNHGGIILVALGLFVAAFGGLVAGVIGKIELANWIPAAPPTVREVTLQATAIGFAHDDDERDVIWCFVRTAEGVYVLPDSGLPWRSGNLAKRLGHERLQFTYLDSELLRSKQSGQRVIQYGLQDLGKDLEPTWSDGPLDIDLELPKWTQINAPHWLGPH